MNKKFMFLFLVFLLFLLFIYILLTSGPSVTSVFPQPNRENVAISVNPYAVFSKPVPKIEQNRFAVKVSPSINFSLYWSADGKTLYLAPDKFLSQNTSYQITISSPTKSYSWSFKTTGAAVFDQGQLDREYSRGLESFYSSHPWYNKIPPKNDDFFIGFDASKNEFFVDLFPKKSSSLTIDQQTDQLKKQVLETLLSIGVDTVRYKIVWVVYPR